MPDISKQGFWTNEAPPSYKYTHIGTAAAASTTTISNIPAILHSLVINTRGASGTVIAYDSVGTSASVIGSIALGTNTSNDNPPPNVYDAQTITGLTIVNSANIDLTILSLP